MERERNVNTEGAREMNEETDTRTKTKGVKKEKAKTDSECAPVCAYVFACLYIGAREENMTERE